SRRRFSDHPAPDSRKPHPGRAGSPRPTALAASSSPPVPRLPSRIARRHPSRLLDCPAGDCHRTDSPVPPGPAGLDLLLGPVPGPAGLDLLLGPDPGPVGLDLLGPVPDPVGRGLAPGSAGPDLGAALPGPAGPEDRSGTG